MSTAGAARCVLLLVEHRGNRAQLVRWLEGGGDFTVLEEPSAEIDPDVVIVDGPGFENARSWLESKRAAIRPVFLGCLLITRQREIGMMSGELWRVVDEVVTTPIRQPELRVRIERLLMTRALSLSGESARSELQRSNVDLERFAFVAAHELVAPLSIVMGGVATVRQLLRDRVTEDERAVLEETMNGCMRMHTMLEDILAYARADQPVRREPVDIAAVVADAIADLGAGLDTSTARVDIEPLPTLAADSTQLRLVFRNLIGNALKFARPGVAPHVRVTARQEDGEWIFSVVDNGIGLEEGDGVFALFDRGREGRRYSGSGIGLAICRRVVDRHGGRIWHLPSDDGGSTFCFTLPD